ncbi:glycosyltransferase family 4 protein [Agromyces bauzanensis]
MTHIVQIAPAISPGSGVAGVAHALEREFIASGCTVERFTTAEAGHRRRREPRSAFGIRVSHVRDVVWFSTVGTRRARRYLAERPDAVSICHNDAMVGDIYVNHGLLEAAMRARGHYAWRMLRNPLHIFTAIRDRIRYGGRTHRAIVALTHTEAELLRSTYGRVHAPIHVIPNGVDLDRFRPASEEERRRARATQGFGDDALVALFIGHEFERKGLALAMAALRHAPTATLLVVGGTPDMIRRASAEATNLGVAGRVRFVGSHADPIPFIHAADVFVLPSAYESYGLVVMEALASGLPVVSTPVGVAPDVVVDGVNGYLVSADEAAIGTRLAQLAAEDLDAFRRHARESVADHTWRQAADRYLELVETTAKERRASVTNRRLRIVHAIRSDGFSGVEQFVLRLAVQQAQDGHEVAVIGGAPDRMGPVLEATDIRHVPATRTIDVARAVRRLARGADVVNTHMTAADVGTVAALWFRRRSRRPAVVATRHFARSRGRVGPLPIGALLRRRIDTQLSISTAVADAIDGASTVVHSGIESRPLRDGLLRERVVLMAQRLQPEKRTDIGLRAFAASGLAAEDWTLEIAGAGPERDALEGLAASLAVGDAVRFLGYRSDLPAVMDRAGILIAPCPIEGLGLTLLEAMAGGLPVVAAGAAGHLDPLSGLDPRALFAPGDVDEAARNLRSLASDDAGRNAFALAARHRQQQEYSLRAQADATEAVYRSVT